MTSAIEEIFDCWTGSSSQGFGIADDLRCCAMVAQEDGVPRADYMAEAEKRGYNQSTAARCWAFVAMQ